jgi:hypothetical protein
VVHRREWRLSAAGLRVIDRLEGEPRTALAVFHLHPLIRPSEVGADLALLRVERSTWHPRFGETADSIKLIADFPGRHEMETVFRWAEATV